MSVLSMGVRSSALPAFFKPGRSTEYGDMNEANVGRAKVRRVARQKKLDWSQDAMSHGLLFEKKWDTTSIS